MGDVLGAGVLRGRRALVWLGTAIPILLLGWLIHSQQIDKATLSESVDLAGPWRLISGESPHGDDPALDDSQAPVVRVPGGFAAQGYDASGCWARRHFNAPPPLLGQPLFLVLGDTRSGTGQLYINGVSIGELDTIAHGAKTEAGVLQGWDVPAQLLRPKDNVLAIHFAWHAAGEDGIRAPHLLLGPREDLTSAYQTSADNRRLLQYGATFLMLFLLVMFGALLAGQWNTPNRPLYLACMGLLSAALLYLSVRTGVLFRLPVASSWGTPLTYLSILGLIFAQTEFGARYAVGPRSRFRRFNALVCLIFLVGFAASFAAARSQWSIAISRALGAYAVMPMAYLVGVFAQRITRRSDELDPLLLVGVLCSITTAADDFLYVYGLTGTGYLFPLGISASAIIAAVVLIADFTKVSFDNRELSQSLQVTNVDLADALVKAQEAARLKSEFVANVSHELRTPLNSVLNIPEGLLEQFDPLQGVRCNRCQKLFELEAGEQITPTTPCMACGETGLKAEQSFQFKGDGRFAVRSLKQIHRAGTHLLNLINDVLDFSKLEAGRMRLSLEWIDVAAALTNVIDTLEPVAATRQVRLKLQTPAGGLALRADAVKLSQIFINLVGNAVKFSRENGEVVVGAQQQDGKWLMWVKDRGIGIATEHHELIFESFRQVDGSNTRRYGGTGLGLAITRKLTEAHGGRVWVESKLGEGSTFYIELPREGPPESMPVVPELSIQTTGRSILILDDERFAVENLKSALQPLGHQIEGIGAPEELEEAIRTFKPDLLILDIMMPGISGLDILKTLQAQSNPLPVLVSSAYHNNIDIVRAMGAAWLGKPWRADELQGEVTRLLMPRVSDRLPEAAVSEVRR